MFSDINTTNLSYDHVEIAELSFNGIPAGYTSPRIIPKNWGHEVVHINTPRYCCKTLFIKRGQNTSCHFHMNKHETMLVTKGILHIRVYNTSLLPDEEKKLFKEYKDYDLHSGDSFIIAPGMVHQLICSWEDEFVEFIECSTYSEDKDSHRLFGVGRYLNSSIISPALKCKEN